MAKSQKRGSKGAEPRGKAAARGATRTQSKKKAAAPAAEVEIVEEEKGLGLDDGMIVIASIILLVAILMVDKAQAAYDAGFFF